MEIKLTYKGDLRWNAERYRWEVDGESLGDLPDMVAQERYSRESGVYAKVSIEITSIEPILEEPCEEQE